MNFLENMLFLFFQKVCGICGEISKDYLCKKCKNEYEKSIWYLNKIEDYSKDTNKYFDEHAYIFEYNDKIREKIIKYKFGDDPYLGKTFSEFFIKNKKMCGFFEKYDIIIPVPMSYKKERQRGYNQSKIIAQIIAKNMPNLTIKNNILIKCKNNKTQSKLSKSQRITNVKDVYKLKETEKIKGKNILIFDDIYTTGATCNECARILKQAGPNKIGVITIAKDYGNIQTNINEGNELNGRFSREHIGLY